jgi:peptide/nickel transport system substrate-binding protein
MIGMAMPWTGIVCPAGLKNPDDLLVHPQGSGAYTLDQGRSARGDHYVLVPRKDYGWGAWGMRTSDPNMPTELMIRIIGDNTTAANELIAGDVDMSVVTGKDVARLKADPNLTATQSPVFGMFFLEMQHAAGHPTADPMVRHAIMTAINRDNVNRAATFGNGITATSYIGPDVPCYDPTTALRIVHPSCPDGYGIWEMSADSVAAWGMRASSPKRSLSPTAAALAAARASRAS